MNAINLSISKKSARLLDKLRIALMSGNVPKGDDINNLAYFDQSDALKDLGGVGVDDIVDNKSVSSKKVLNSWKNIDDVFTVTAHKKK